MINGDYMVKALAYTTYSSQQGLQNRIWIDVSQVMYTVSSAYNWSIVGCPICSPTQLRVVDPYVPTVEVAHYINGAITWVGDYTSDTTILQPDVMCDVPSIVLMVN